MEASAAVTWQLDAEAFQALLHRLGPDGVSAGERYQQIREKLIRYFEWERCPSAQDCADRTIDRVARRIVEGEQIANFEGYFHGVARMVAREARAHSGRITSLTTALEPAFSSAAESRIEPELECLNSCMKELDEAQRRFLLSYYTGEGRTRIQQRQKLAEELGLPLNAVRNRALRLRGSLENCVKNCAAKLRS
jgi:DNA-directed RNA polymerase specialized sigma24 family protein